MGDLRADWRRWKRWQRIAGVLVLAGLAAGAASGYFIAG
jgi:HAMP domain-containing protein